jgi:hypothetical protein
MEERMRTRGPIKFRGQEPEEVGQKPSPEHIAQAIADAKVRGNQDEAASVSDTEGKWYAVQSGQQQIAQASLAGRRFGTDNPLPGYVLIHSKDISKDAEKINDTPGAVGILTRAGTDQYAEISADEIANIKSGSDQEETALILPFPKNRRGGKRVKARKKAAWRRLRVYGTADKSKAA